MFEALFFSALFVAAALAAVFAYVAVIGATQLNRHRETGWLHLVPYFIFLTVALATISSNRDLTMGAWALLSQEAEARAPWAAWMQRATTLLLLLVAAERIASAIFRGAQSVKFIWLLPVFVMYWCSAVASPSLLGRHPDFSYEFLYPLLLGVAGLLVSPKDGSQFIGAMRNATLMFIAAGFAWIPLKTGLVLETNYSQGFIPGLPRLAGLSPHALQLGLVAQVAMLTLWVMPLSSKWWNRSAWSMCLIVLFLAQSKTAWISFAACAVVMQLVRQGPAVRRWVFNSERPVNGVVSVLGLMGCALLFAYVVLFSHMGEKVIDFLDTKEGATLLTLNGRASIWEVAFQEWRQNPIFGYGPSFLNLAHRTSIGMLNATHAHNQFVDDLARAGLVGAVGLSIYGLTLLVLSVRYAKLTQGLSIALYMVTFFRAVSEVPLSMYGYSGEFAPHLLLLVVLAMAIRSDHSKKHWVPAAGKP